MDNQMVVFELGSEHFGVNISKVESIIKMQPITQLPNTPEFVEGVTNLRGKVLPVIDLRKRFNFAAQEASQESHIIVVSVNDMEVGMIVDEVSEVVTVPESAVEAAPAITTGVDSAFITGIAKLDGRLVILLDLDHVLATQERVTLQAMA
jgi:purine-binding chemotaxis protein CheW